MTPVCPPLALTGRYTIAEAARLLDVHRNTITRWLRDGVFTTSEYNRRKATGRVFIKGAALRRVWGATMY